MNWKQWQKEVNEALESSSERAIDTFIENDKFFKLKEWLGILSPSLMQLGYYDKKKVEMKKKPDGYGDYGYGEILITGPGTLYFDNDYTIETLSLDNSSSTVAYQTAASPLAKALLNSEKEQKMEKLYYNSTDEEYGTILAYDKNGNAVFEPRGGGKIKQVSPDSLEEVKPYTVEVKYVGNRGEATYGFQVDKDAGLKVGDIVYATDYNQFVVVVGVDTQTDFATKRLKGNLMTLGQTLE